MSDGLDCLLWDDLSRRVTAAVGLLATATLHLGARKPVSDDPCPSANLYGGSISLRPTLARQRLPVVLAAVSLLRLWAGGIGHL